MWSGLGGGWASVYVSATQQWIFVQMLVLLARAARVEVEDGDGHGLTEHGADGGGRRRED